MASCRMTYGRTMAARQSVCPSVARHVRKSGCLELITDQGRLPGFCPGQQAGGGGQRGGAGGQAGRPEGQIPGYLSRAWLLGFLMGNDSLPIFTIRGWGSSELGLPIGLSRTF